MRTRIALSLAFALGLGAAVAMAQAPSPAAPAPTTTAAPSATSSPQAPPSGASGITRRDPEGRKGVSPYTEAVIRGQNSYIARDFPGAVTAFQDAIKIDPQQMLGFYLLGEAQIEAGKPEEADAAWTAGLSKKGPEDLSSKLLFVLADLRERQKNWPKAKEAWTAYAAFLKAHPEVKGYPATPEDRIKRIDQRIKDEADYAKVKERIKQREEEREKEARENAKKDKLNK